MRWFLIFDELVGVMRVVLGSRKFVGRIDNVLARLLSIEKRFDHVGDDDGDLRQILAPQPRRRRWVGHERSKAARASGRTRAIR
jgi:hypothetical protein